MVELKYSTTKINRTKIENPFQNSGSKDFGWTVQVIKQGRIVPEKQTTYGFDRETTTKNLKCVLIMAKKHLKKQFF